MIRFSTSTAAGIIAAVVTATAVIVQVAMPAVQAAQQAETFEPSPLIIAPNFERSSDIRPDSSDRPNRPVDRFSLSLSDAFNTAATSNPQVVATQKNIDIAAAQIKTAGAIPNPQFAMQYGWGNAYTKTIAGNTQQVGLNQLVETAGKRSARLKLAKANFELAQRQLDALKFDIRSQVRRGYADLAAAEANIELVENQKEFIDKLYGIAHKRVLAKKATQAEEVQAKIAVDQFEVLRTSALATLRQASIKLDFLLGYKASRDLDVEDNGLFRLSSTRNELVPQPDFNLPPLTQLIAKAYEQRPDLRASTQQVLVNGRALSLAKRQAVPDILIGGGYVFSTYNVNTVKQQYGAYLNANVDIPVFYQHQGEIALAKANLEQSKAQITMAKAQLETDVQVAYSALTAARASIMHYQSVLIPSAKKVVTLAQQSYESGQSDLSNAIVAQQSFQDTLSGYFDQVVNYQKAWADLEKAIGTPVNF